MLNIQSNGSKWAGEKPDSIEILLDLLAKEPLLRDQESYSFPHPNSLGFDGEPLYPNTNTWHFSGNFYNRSHGFSIFTDEPELIEKLRRAIDLNMSSDAYLAQKPPKYRLACEIDGKRKIIHV